MGGGGGGGTISAEGGQYLLADYVRGGQFSLADYVRGDKICGGDRICSDTGPNYTTRVFLVHSDHHLYEFRATRFCSTH